MGWLFDSRATVSQHDLIQPTVFTLRATGVADDRHDPGAKARSAVMTSPQTTHSGFVGGPWRPSPDSDHRP